MHGYGGNSVSIMEIRDLEIPELEVYIDKKEVQLLHYYEPEPGIFIAESPNVILRALEAGYEPLSLLMEKKPPGEKERAILDRCGEIPVYTASLEVLTRITGYQLARGMLCAMRRKALPSLKEIGAGKHRIVTENKYGIAVVGFRVKKFLDFGNAEAAVQKVLFQDFFLFNGKFVRKQTGCFQCPFSWTCDQ